MPHEGDVIVKICEGVREIVVSKSEAKPNGVRDTADDDDSEEEDEEEEVRNRVFKVERVVAEAAVRGLTKGSKIEVTLNVGSDLGLSVAARVVGGQQGVRGTVEGTEKKE